jgi:hypothetical protein
MPTLAHCPLCGQCLGDADKLQHTLGHPRSSRLAGRRYMEELVMSASLFAGAKSAMLPYIDKNMTPSRSQSPLTADI